MSIFRNIALFHMPPAGAHAAFEQARTDLRLEFGAEVFRSWLESLTLVAAYDDSLVFLTHTATARDWLMRNVQHRLEAHLSSRMTLKAPISISIQADLPDALKELLAESGDERAAPVESVQTRARFAFENFCVGTSNEAAYAVARAIASGEADALPLVLIHGAPGVGKTH